MSMSPRLLRPRATGFNVKALSGLVYWLDASQSSTISIGTGVSEWRDAAGGSIKASQGTANAQPAYQTAQKNGRNAVYFDGTNDTMTIGDLSANFPSAGSAIFAFQPDTDTEYTLFQTAHNSSFWAYTARTYIGVFKTTRLNNVAAPLMPTASAAVLAITSSSSAYRVYINGAIAHDVAADFSAGTAHNIGANGLGTTYKGWLYEAIFSSSELSASTLTAATSYLKSKWGI